MGLKRRRSVLESGDDSFKRPRQKIPKLVNDPSIQVPSKTIMERRGIKIPALAINTQQTSKAGHIEKERPSTGSMAEQVKELK